MTPDLMDLTEGWLVDWSKGGGRFKEWVRHLHLSAINHGWLRVLADEPVRWARRAAHVVSWWPVLWDDYDFDHSYLWIVMREKIRRMERLTREQQHFVGWEKVADEMHIADILLTRLIEDRYSDYDWDVHNAKYGEAFPAELREERADGTVVYNPRPDQDGSRSADIRRIRKREYASRRGDMEYLGRFLARKIRNWWS